jgi:CBS domain-containing protein
VRLVFHFLQGGDYAKAFAELPVVTVSASSTFETVLELLATKGLHRVYVVDADGKPTSVITLTDVLRKVSLCFKHSGALLYFPRMPQIVAYTTCAHERQHQTGHATCS